MEKFKKSLYIFFSFTLLLIIPQKNYSKTEYTSLLKSIPDSLPYLGQTPPDTVPVIFGSGFISSTTAAEYSICFSQDGKEIYFSRNTTGVSNTIWWTHFTSGLWTTPETAPFTGSYYNSEPFITYDNQKMYFISEREAANDYQIWYMSRSGPNWSAPVKLGAPFALDKGKMFPTLAANGNIYFTQWDLSTKSYFYMAKNINGVFDTPVKLSANINAFYIHGHIFVAPDESYLVFDVIPTQQSSGSIIYASFRKADSTWGNPIRLSNTINATDNQYCPYISPDGKYLFFTKQQDLWWVDSKVVTRHKPVGIQKEGNAMPKDCNLFQNYPNPFNPATTIKFQIKDSRYVTLKVYDISGKEVTTLIKEKLSPGEYSIKFSASQCALASGIYIYKIEAEGYTDTKKMILIK